MELIIVRAFGNANIEFEMVISPQLNIWFRFQARDRDQSGSQDEGLAKSAAVRIAEK